jgi:hypothetical protein
MRWNRHKNNINRKHIFVFRKLQGQRYGKQHKYFYRKYICFCLQTLHASTHWDHQALSLQKVVKNSNSHYCNTELFYSTAVIITADKRSPRMIQKAQNLDAEVRRVTAASTRSCRRRHHVEVSVVWTSLYHDQHEPFYVVSPVSRPNSRHLPCIRTAHLNG